MLIGEDGREVILGVLEPGAHFGELALIDDQPRSAHVIAMEDAQLLDPAPRGFPSARRGATRPSRGRSSPSCRAACAAPTRRSAASCCSTSPAASPGSCWTSRPRPAATTIEKPLTHQTIAQMIGASRETVSRAMKEFQEAGLIRVERRRIAVANRDALEKRAQVRM